MGSDSFLEYGDYVRVDSGAKRFYAVFDCEEFHPMLGDCYLVRDSDGEEHLARKDFVTKIHVEYSSTNVDPPPVKPAPEAPTKRRERPEEIVQAASIKLLEENGFRVKQTSVRYKLQKCKKCGHSQRPTGGYGASGGVPDLLVRHPSWPKGLWRGIEIKGPTTRISPEQKKLAAEDAIFIVRSAADALEAANAPIVF